MATSQRAGIDPEAVRSHARGKPFRILLIAAWPAGVLIGLAGSLIFGGGIAVGIAGGLALALGLSFVWVVVMLAIDDGDVDDQVRKAVLPDDPEHEGAVGDGSEKTARAGDGRRGPTTARLRPADRPPPSARP
jgi:hypothetical protein